MQSTFAIAPQLIPSESELFACLTSKPRMYLVAGVSVLLYAFIGLSVFV